MSSEISKILILLVITTFLIFCLAAFIVIMLYLYQRKQLAYLKLLEEIRLNYEKQLLRSELEIQEQTIQHISREIHDNIGLSLTLAKLQLNDALTKQFCSKQLTDAITILTKAIHDLSNLSKSLNAQFIGQNGFVKALRLELDNIASYGKHNVVFEVDGEIQFVEKHKEIVLFRIIQEALNNIMKHSESNVIHISITFDYSQLNVHISDNGKGFDPKHCYLKGSGLSNIESRIKVLEGKYAITSEPNLGTKIFLNIPYNSNT